MEWSFICKNFDSFFPRTLYGIILIKMALWFWRKIFFKSRQRVFITSPLFNLGKGRCLLFGQSWFPFTKEFSRNWVSGYGGKDFFKCCQCIFTILLISSLRKKSSQYEFNSIHPKMFYAKFGWNDLQKTKVVKELSLCCYYLPFEKRVPVISTN